MSDFKNLIYDVQEYVCEILNQDDVLSSYGAVFYAENSLDIDYEIKNSLMRQGLACVVMTPSLSYRGTDALTQVFDLNDLTIQVVENSTLNRARLKKQNLSCGTALDICTRASDLLAGPQSGHYGEFTTKSIEEGEDSGLIVAKAIFGCTLYHQISGVISSDLSGHKVEIPFVTKDEISGLVSDVHYLSGLVDGFSTEEIKTRLSSVEGDLNDIQIAYLDLSNVYQPIGNYLTPDDLTPYALKSELPTRTSELENDSGYMANVYWEDISDRPNVALKSEIPTKTSELDNDAGFTKVRESNDYPGYAENARESVYANQCVYAEVATTAMNVEWSSVTGRPNVPTKTSEIQNDSGFLSSVDWGDIIDKPDIPLCSDIPTNVSQLNNDVGYLSTVSWNDVQDKPYIVERDYLDWRLEEYPTKVEMNNTIDEKISEIVIPDNTKLYSPSKNRYIQGDSSVWENRTVPGHWSNWVFDDGQEHQIELQFDSEHNNWKWVVLGEEGWTPESFVEEDEARNATDLFWINQEESLGLNASREWIEEKTEFIQVETLAYESHIPVKASDLRNDAGYLSSVSWTDVSDKPNVALKNEIPTRTSELINDSGFITTSPDFSQYYTKNECNDRFQPIGNYLTAHQSLAEYLTEFEIASTYQPIGNYLTAHQSLANYYTKQECDERFGSSTSIVKQLYSPNEQRYIDGDGLVWKQEETGFWSEWEWSSGIQEDLECAYISDIDKWSFFLRSKAYYLLDNLWWNTQEEAEAWLDEQDTLEFEKDGEFFITGTRHWHTSGYKWKYYDDLAKKSELPTKTSDLTNDSGFLTSVYWSDVQQKPDLVTESQLNSLRNQISNDLQTKLNIADYDNTRLHSPTDQQFIDGDGKVWSNREGHWTAWEYSDGMNHGDPTIVESGSRWCIVVDIVYRTNEYSTLELAEEALNGNMLTFLYAADTITANRTWIPEGLQQTNELAYKSDLSDFNNRIDETEAEIDGLSTRIDTISYRLESAESRIDEAENSIEEVASSVEDVQSTISQVQTTVNQVQTSLAQVQTNVQSVQTQLSGGQWIDLIGEMEDGTTVTFQIFAKGI